MRSLRSPRGPLATVTGAHPVTIARLLEALREAGATEAVTALATRAVDGADLSRTSGIERLLRALREAGATDAVTALAARAWALTPTSPTPV